MNPCDTPTRPTQPKHCTDTILVFRNVMLLHHGHAHGNVILGYRNYPLFFIWLHVIRLSLEIHINIGKNRGKEG